jgi:hypothetical protein
MVVWLPILGMFRSVVVTLTYVRRNHVQVELAETFDVSQPTISRAITSLTGLLGRMLLLPKSVPVGGAATRTRLEGGHAVGRRSCRRGQRRKASTASLSFTSFRPSILSPSVGPSCRTGRPYQFARVTLGLARSNDRICRRRSA